MNGPHESHALFEKQDAGTADARVFDVVRQAAHGALDIRQVSLELVEMGPHVMQAPQQDLTRAVWSATS